MSLFTRSTLALVIACGLAVLAGTAGAQNAPAKTLDQLVQQISAEASAEARYDDDRIERFLAAHDRQKALLTEARAARDSASKLADRQRSEWLGQLWLQARERGQAKAALALAMQQSESGRAADLLGRLEFEDENWAAAMAALDQARHQGSLDSPQQTSLLLGIAALREQSFQTARAALESAATHADTANQARYWLSRLE